MTTNDDDRSDDPRTGAYRLGDLQAWDPENERAARESFDRIMDRARRNVDGWLAEQCSECAKDAERRDGVPLAGGE